MNDQLEPFACDACFATVRPAFGPELVVGWTLCMWCATGMTPEGRELLGAFGFDPPVLRTCDVCDHTVPEELTRHGFAAQIETTQCVACIARSHRRDGYPVTL